MSDTSQNSFEVSGRSDMSQESLEMAQRSDMGHASNNEDNFSARALRLFKLHDTTDYLAVFGSFVIWAVMVAGIIVLGVMLALREAWTVIVIMVLVLINLILLKMNLRVEKKKKEEYKGLDERSKKALEEQQDQQEQQVQQHNQLLYEVLQSNASALIAFNETMKCFKDILSEMHNTNKEMHNTNKEMHNTNKEMLNINKEMLVELKNVVSQLKELVDQQGEPARNPRAGRKQDLISSMGEHSEGVEPEVSDNEQKDDPETSPEDLEKRQTEDDEAINNESVSEADERIE